MNCKFCLLVPPPLQADSVTGVCPEAQLRVAHSLHTHTHTCTHFTHTQCHCSPGAQRPTCNSPGGGEQRRGWGWGREGRGKPGEKRRVDTTRKTSSAWTSSRRGQGHPSQMTAPTPPPPGQERALAAWARPGQVIQVQRLPRELCRVRFKLRRSHEFATDWEPRALLMPFKEHVVL